MPAPAPTPRDDPRTTDAVAPAPAPVHPVDQSLPPLRTVVSGLQHVAAMYAGVVAPPLIVGSAAGLAAHDLTFLTGACLFTAGLATLLQTLGIWRIGARLPFVNGVTFAGVAPMLAVAGQVTDPHDTLPVIYGAVIVAGLLGFVAAPFFSRAVRFFPPVVTGTVITLIGVSLLPVAFGWAQGPDAPAPGHGSGGNLALAGATLLIVLLLRRFTRGFLRQIAVLVGLVAGTVAAVPFGVTDFGPLTGAAPVGFPSPFHFGAPQFQLTAIVSLCVVMVVSMTESTADMLALGEVVGRRADERTIAAGLRADTLGSAVSPLFNGFMCSAFAQNIGLVAMSRIRSRFVVATGGGILVLMGLCPAAAALIAVVPRPVLGGAGVVLFGSVAVSGIRTLAGAGLHRDGNAMTVAVSLAVGLVPIAVPDFYHAFPDTVRIVLDSGISTGCVAAVVLNLLFHHTGGRAADGDGDEDDGSPATAAPGAGRR